MWSFSPPLFEPISRFILLAFVRYPPVMENYHLFHPEHDPEFDSKQLEGIYQRWTAQDHIRDSYTDGPTKTVNILEHGRWVVALMMSRSLAEKTQNALCIAHEYWDFADKMKTLFEKEARTQSWEDELNHLIKLTKKKVRRTGKPTREQRDGLKMLLEERLKCRKTMEWNERQRQKHEEAVKLGRERWTNAWFSVQQELDRVWVDDDKVKRYRRGQSHAQEASVPRSRQPRRRSRSRSPDRRDHSPSRSRSRSFSRFGNDRPCRDIAVSPARSAASGAELNRLADSMCDTSKILQGFLDVTKPAQYLPIMGGNRDEDVEVVGFGVAPSASIADCIGQLDSAVTIDDSGASTAGKAFPDIAPISQQAQEFQDGLRKLALQYDSGDTQPQQFPEAHSCHPSGSKRKRIDRTPSERKLQKMSPSIASDSRTSTPEHTAVGWVQGESGMQRVAGQTPGSSRLSIRDFFKPGCGTGESLNMPTLDR